MLQTFSQSQHALCESFGGPHVLLCIPPLCALNLFSVLALSTHSACLPAIPLPTLEDKGSHTGLPGPLCSVLPTRGQRTGC